MNASRCRNGGVIALVLGLLLLAACGQETSPRERLAAAPEATAREGTVAFTLEVQMQMGGEGSGMTMTMSGDGVMDLVSRRGRISMDLPGMEGAMTMVFDSTDIYLRVPGMPVEGDKRWIRQKGAYPGSGPPSGFPSDPSWMWSVLDDVEEEVYELGPDVVRGTDVRGFSFTVSGEKLWGDREDVPAAVHEMNVPIEVWLDGQDRVRRMSLAMDMGPVAGALRERMADSLSRPGGEGALEKLMMVMSGTMKLTREYFDFGTKVQVELPDSTEVMDAPEL